MIKYPEDSVDNALPSMRIAEAEDAVKRESGIVSLVHLSDWRNGSIRYMRKVNGKIQIQAFHRSFLDAMFGRMPFRGRTGRSWELV